MQITVFLALVLGFAATTGAILIEWLAPGRVIQGSFDPWRHLMLFHGLTGHMLAGYVAVLSGWRLNLRWLETLGWLGLSAQLLALGIHFGTAETPTELFGQSYYASPIAFALIMLPRLLFLLTLIVWARQMVQHGLLFMAALSVCFLGMLALFVTNVFNDWSFPGTISDTAVATSLAHTALYVPLLLAVPAFLFPAFSPVRLAPTAWTGAAATVFLVSALILVTLGFQGLPRGFADFPEAYKAGTREFSVLGLVTLALWLGALWTHRR